MRKYLIRNIIWCIIIFVLCAMPGKSLPETSFNIPYIDKIVHLGMFFVMGIFLCAELKYQTSLSFSKITLITILSVSFYGGLIEVLQHYVFVDRSGDYVDFIFDVAGGGSAALIYPWLKRKKDIFIKKEPFCRFAILKKII